VTVSTRRLRDKVLAIAAEMLEIAVEDLEIDDGVVIPRGVPERSVALAEIARRAILSPGTLPPGVDTDLDVAETFAGEGITGSGWSGGTHLCIVEVDPMNGFVEILRYLVVEDCGRIINPAVVDGQIAGGVAQGIGAVLYEHMPYDADGNVLAGTFVDYLIPTSAEIPALEIDHLEQEADGDLSFRGVGEGGAIVAPATVTNAIEDALLPLGVRIHEQHLPPTRLLELMGVIR
jgi:carbon-monoxide dehydrogenase large subunit